MNPAVVNGLLTLVNSLITLSANSAKLRAATALAIAENRALTDAELQTFATDAQDAIDTARQND